MMRLFVFLIYCFSLENWLLANESLEIQFVRPVLKEQQRSAISLVIRRHQSWDPHEKQLEDAFAKMKTIKDLTGKLFYVFEVIPEAEVSPSLRRMTASEVVKDSLRLRKQARKITTEIQGKLDLYDCVDTPLYISSSHKAVFGLGPVFVDQTNFLIEGVKNNSEQAVPSNNMIIMEDGLFFARAALSTQSFAQTGYLPFVIAHENAHGIMQDVYGLKAFGRLYSKINSKNGHDVSLTTDPALALIEGFAEAFEAYYYEKYSPLPIKLKPRQFDSSVIATQVNLMSAGYRTIDRFATFFITVFEEDHFSRLFAKYLEQTRIQPIIQNQYLLEDPPLMDPFKKAILLWDEHYSLTTALDQLELALPSRAHAREGVIAHQFYTLLKAGKFEQIVEVIARYHPMNYWEFYRAYIHEFPNDHRALAQAFFNSFGKEARVIQNRMYVNDRMEAHRERSWAFKKEDFVIATYDPEDFETYKAHLSREFPEVLDLLLITKFSDYENIIESLLTKNRKEKKEPKFFSKDQLLESEKADLAIYAVQRSKYQLELQEDFEREWQNSMQQVYFDVDRWPQAMWLETRQGTTLRRHLLGMGIQRIDLNSASSGELLAFLNALYMNAVIQRSSEKRSALTGFWTYFSGYLSILKQDEIYKIRDIILRERTKKGSQGFTSLEDLRTSLPEAWYLTLLHALVDENLFQK